MEAIKIRAKTATAELVATFLFVYTGCGSVFSSGGDKLTIALAFGLSITSLAYTVGHVSGGHMNPIVTIAMCILGELDVLSGLFYIFAQCLGATAAALFLSIGLVNDEMSISNVVNGINDANTNIAGAFIMEVILSFLLVYVVSETAVNSKSGAGNCAPIAIGIAVFMAHIVAIPFTGCSINPARSLGPAIVSGNFTDLWLFFVAPICGGSIAALTAKYVFGVLEKNVTRVVDDENLPYDKLYTPATDERTANSNLKRAESGDTSDSSYRQSVAGSLSFPVSMAPLDEEVEVTSP